MSGIIDWGLRGVEGNWDGLVCLAIIGGQYRGYQLARWAYFVLSVMSARTSRELGKARLSKPLPPTGGPVPDDMKSHFEIVCCCCDASRQVASGDVASRQDQAR